MRTKVFFNISELVTVSANGLRSKTKSKMNDLAIIPNGAFSVVDGKFAEIGTKEELSSILNDENVQKIDCQNKVVMPGFVDSHTHIVFAGNRSHEFARRLQGVSYQQIASEGGGILTTVKAVRNASVEELYEVGKRLALSAMKHGTTTIEIKSGYGLLLDAELNQLKAIKHLQEDLPINIVSTFLGAHDFPPEYSSNRESYVALIIDEMLPKVAEYNLAEFCDVFADNGYYTLDQTKRILQRAIELGFKTKIHADELSKFNAAELAIELQSSSTDHLLFVSDEAINSFHSSNTVATLLPGTAYTLRLPYAPARKLIDKGATVALATDCNPGSCFNENMQSIISLACMNMNMSIEESIVASTLHGAKALERTQSKGSIEVGKDADFIILNTSSYPDLVYHFGTNHVEQTWIDGKLVS